MSKATDIVNKGKLVLKQWQLEPLSGVSNHDPNFLLEKVRHHHINLVHSTCETKIAKQSCY